MAASSLSRYPTSDGPAVASAIGFLRARGLLEPAPEVAIVAGSGLGDALFACVREAVSVPTATIPGFVPSTVAGHKGELVFGYLEGRRVVLQRGRLHAYEGHSTRDVVRPMRVFAAMGCRAALVTNAAGGLDRAYRVGDIMIIRDQVYLPGLSGFSPMGGPNDAVFGPRFAAINGAYDARLRALARIVARDGVPDAPAPAWLREGVYAGVAGPLYESNAEVDFLEQIGCSSCGMSTAPEVQAAAHAGLPILGLSLITNRSLHKEDALLADQLAETAVRGRWDAAAGAAASTASGSGAKVVAAAAPTHDEVLQAAGDDAFQARMQKVVQGVVKHLDIAIPERKPSPVAAAIAALPNTAAPAAPAADPTLSSGPIALLVGALIFLAVATLQKPRN